MRQLKYHEQKLLKKVNLYSWKREYNERETKIARRYYIQDREDYVKYNRLCGYITKLVSGLRKLDPNDEFRIKATSELLNKLYHMGVISSRMSLEVIEHLPASAFCRRRLAVVLVQLKFCPDLKDAVTFIEQGHIRIGPNVIYDPAYHVSRDIEDFITWSQGSKIKRAIDKFNNTLDDFELLGN
ncbi:U3 small nucleolar ribonucleoprotein IMP3, putative [Cryptosporidium muris RN66]|uniref:U3 small nucleolar ribonucleoprotein protein IMP3 n=1 Tax=Cryptosporidium muris (strain RN66) TaxID=441375 RepID=B6AFC5_CRYMR|nr:U3 small nucleolar ribonucleoprotein IMP3, putative [Cryptosporidium muris RN66]EEA06916.1 U3 small nucleolar ribonucleoprotein protein IMP3, putative [Cryptosporidium muris RN66]|eukprot:XP_002141265.1 U3 small nucleolar ribonucleoprotein protein IMP3 [Cryptosporidium muris RN66]